MMIKTDTSAADKKDSLTATMEDYLKVIYNLSKEKRAVRVKDIAKKLGVKMPSVTSMLRTLGEKGMIDYEKYEYLELNTKGLDIAKEIDRRHHTIKKFLIDILKIKDDQADEDACKMEHAVSGTTIDRIIYFMEFVKNCPRVGEDWLDLFDKYRKSGKTDDECLKKMKKFAREYTSKIKNMENN